MQVLHETKICDWLAKFPHRNADAVQSDARGPLFSGPEASGIDLDYLAKLEKLPFVARLLATIGL